jgi:hypothetical protein
MIADIGQQSLVGCVGIAHDVGRPAIRQPRRIGGDWVVLIMISGLAATPALLSASRTAFGLVGLDTARSSTLVSRGQDRHGEGTM